MSTPHLRIGALATLALLVPLCAHAEAQRDRFTAGGYFRVMTRPDFQGGNGKLGFWNLYGRLLNEGPYAALELRYDVLQPTPESSRPWAAVQAKIEGGSVGNADPTLGNLGAFRLSQLYVKAGNILLDKVTWQVGTLESYFGDLGLYDLRPAQVLSDMVGLSGRYESEHLEVLLGVGDSGYPIRGANYDTILTAGGTVRLRFGKHLELGTGGEVEQEPQVTGNRFAPYSTPGVSYEDFRRHEVVTAFFRDHPEQAGFFPNPVPRANDWFKVVGYLGFGDLGPLRWNNLFANYLRRPPQTSYTESYNGKDYQVYVADLTDEKYQVNVGDELQLALWPDHLDAAVGFLYGHYFDLDDTVGPGDDNRDFWSSVVRLQLYLTSTVHWLVETSYANEHSLQGNLYREHQNSIFSNTHGVTDSRGFEYGDTDTRNTWQLKTGVVLNPTGFGIYTRPSLRLLYGLQYSNQQAAFGNGFVESLDQYNVFAGAERHWHSVVAVEAEGWF